MDASDLPIERSIRFSPILSLTLFTLACWRSLVTIISFMVCSLLKADFRFCFLETVFIVSVSVAYIFSSFLSVTLRCACSAGTAANIKNKKNVLYINV